MPPIETRHTFLQNVLLTPGREEAALVALRIPADLDGVELIDAYLETGAGFTYRLGSGEVSDRGDRRILTSLWLAPEGFTGVTDGADSYAQEVTVRRVEPEVFVPASDFAGMVVLRRYRIQGDWDDFLAIWKEVAKMRERHDFHLTFAVSDREAREFTWAFTTELDDFAFFMSEGQKTYYADPRRVELETINAFLEQITLMPARRIG
jgi:hypothetical protein